MKTDRLEYFFAYAAIFALYANFVLTSGLSLIEGDVFKFAVRGFSALIFIYLIVQEDRYRVWSILAGVALIALALANNNIIILNIAYILLIVAAIRSIPLGRLLRALYYISLVGVLAHVALLSMGVLPLTVLDQQDRIRFSLGFSNPNQLGLFYFSLVSLAAVLWTQCRGRLCFLQFAVLGLASIFSIYLSDSRTFMTASLIVVALAVLTKLGLVGASLSRLAFMAPVMGLLLSFLLVSDIGMIFNEELSLRPIIFRTFMTDRNIVEIMSGWIYDSSVGVDNSYLLVFSAMGVPLAVILVCYLSLRMWVLTGLNAFLVALLFLLSAFESALIRPEMPITILAFYLLFSRERRRLVGRPAAVVGE